jgi:hypothetical protein
MHGWKCVPLLVCVIGIRYRSVALRSLKGRREEKENGEIVRDTAFG